ncbi:MAG: hypothetical protein ACRCU1_18960 [Alsobacter sp.]
MAMVAAIVSLAVACAALAGALTVLIIRHAAIAARALEASDARGRADATLAAKDADLRMSQASVAALKRDLEKQKEVTRALTTLAVQRRGSALDAPGVDPVDLMLALAGEGDAAPDDTAVRAGDAAGAAGGGDQLPRSGRPAPVSDELAGDAALPR